MRTLTNFAITLTVVTLFSACGNNQEPAETDAHAGHNHAPGEGHGTAVTTTPGSVQINDDKLNAVYQHYIHLTTALVNADVTEAKVAASAIELGAKAMDNGTAIAGTAAKIAATGDIDTQRKLYSDLSNDLIARVKRSGLSAGEVYVEYCPMAFNDKGASWLSNKKEIRNPYFGESMLTCGEIKETIN